MQSKDEIEKWYRERDPWNYEVTKDDKQRKDTILSYLKKYGTFKRALDIGAGEGWITKDLPAKTIHGIEWSDIAANRFPRKVKRVLEPDGKYDLIIATGVLYPQYNYHQIIDWIRKAHAPGGIILTSNIKEWERDLDRIGKPDFETTFQYRTYTQHLCIFSTILE